MLPPKWPTTSPLAPDEKELPVQARRLSASLREFAVLLKDEGRTASARELELLADAFSAAGGETVAKVLARTKSYWKSAGHEFAFPETIQARLLRIAAFLEQSGAPQAANAYRAIPRLGVGRSFCEPAVYCRQLKAAIEAPPPEHGSISKPLDLSEIGALASRLTSADGNNNEFDAVLADISGDKRIKKRDLEAVARRFLGTDRNFKTKAEITRAIRSRQLQDALQDSRERRLSKIAV